jgi:hypothetical protein
MLARLAELLFTLCVHANFVEKIRATFIKISAKETVLLKHCKF